MRIIAYRTLRWFGKKHKDAKNPLDAWYRLFKASSWQTPADIKKQFGSASFVANNRVVFNIAGNKYRLIVEVQYQSQITWICWVGSHREYNAVNAAEVQYENN